MMRNDPDPASAVAIDIAAPSALWRARLPEAEALCMVAARAALARAGSARGASELSIVLADDALVRTLNHRWRGQDEPTNVLAFALDEAPGADRPMLLGDVVLAFETVAAEAAAQEKPLANHLRHLVVHGVLHLLGFDHIAAGDARRMEALETRVLAGLGIPDPYRERGANHG